MKAMIREIRKRTGMSQEEFARTLGTSFSSVNRWENGHAEPGAMAQDKLYELCRSESISLEALIDAQIKEELSKCNVQSGRMILYHGSKSGIRGEISPISRDRCDFGRGFYMGTLALQPLTLTSDFEKAKLYIVSLSEKGLKELHIQPDLEWAMLVACHRGKMEQIAGTSFYEHYAHLTENYDLVVGSIADDRMFYVLDQFFQGNITDQALLKSLSALKLGEQYVAVSKKACSRIRIEREMPVSRFMRRALSELSEENRKKGVSLANQICREYRREGLYFDEILEQAAKGSGDLS